MLILASTSDIIRVVTGSAADVDIQASWVDHDTATLITTPGRTITAAVVTATITTVVPSPGNATTKRNVKHLSIHNVSATITTTVTIQQFDGTNNLDLINCTLLPDEHIHFDEQGNWIHSDVQGAPYTYNVPAGGNLGPTGIIAETIPRELCPEVNTTMGATGALNMMAIYLVVGQLVSNIALCSATTAVVTPTGYRFGLYDASRNLRATSADQTTTAWAANTYKSLAMVTPYRVPTSGLYYIGYYMTATTVPTIKGGTAKTGGQLASTVPILHGTSTTGLTTTLPDPAGAISAGTAPFYANVS